MDQGLKNLIESGRKIIGDTKLLKPKPIPKKMSVEESKDPHKVFCQRMITDKPSKAELLADVKKFIEIEEAKL
jgi:hypothetical protein